MSLPNFSRKYFNDSVALLCYLSGRNRKDVLSKLKVCNDDSFFRFLMANFSAMKLRGKISVRDYMSVDYMSSIVTNLLYFDKTLRVCVPSVPDKFKSTYKLDTSLFEENKACFVDFKYNDIECFLDFHENVAPTFLDGKEYKYRIMLNMDTDMFDGYNALGTSYRNSTQKLNHICAIHINEDLNDAYIELNNLKFELVEQVPLTSVTYTFNDKEPKVFNGFTSLESYNSLNLPDADEILGIIHYASYCYKHRTVIHRKSCSANKYYETHKVHVAANEAKEDKYVPLCTYIKEYSPSVKSEYKGGHHASPIEHERRGHFRRTKHNTGNYDLVNGEFVEVKPGTGEYCTVRPSHVSGNKKNVVYKTV